MLAMIWAQARGRAIGKDGTLPWHVPEDMALFKRATLGHPVIMGRKTWESFDLRWRPLPGRDNIVVTRDSSYEAPGARVASSLEAAYDMASNSSSEDMLVWLIGGAQLYAYALEHDLADAALVTHLDIEVPDAHAFAPAIPAQWELAASQPRSGWLASAKADASYRFTLYRKPGSDFLLPLSELS